MESMTYAFTASGIQSLWSPRSVFNRWPIISSSGSRSVSGGVALWVARSKNGICLANSSMMRAAKGDAGPFGCFKSSIS